MNDFSSYPTPFHFPNSSARARPTGVTGAAGAFKGPGLRLGPRNWGTPVGGSTGLTSLNGEMSEQQLREEQ